MADVESADKPSTGADRTGRRLAGKNMAMMGSFGALVVFPDVVFHLIFEVLHFAIGWVELTIEHALQEALDVSRHTAQMLTAWLGLAVLIALLTWLYRKLMPRVRNLYARYRQLGLEWVEKFRARLPGLR